MPTQPASSDDCGPDGACLLRVRELACWWSEVGASRHCPSLELRERLLDLRPHLAHYLASQSSRSTPMLLAELDQLIMRLGVCTPSQACWANLSRGIGRFLSQLQKLDIASRPD